MEAGDVFLKTHISNAQDDLHRIVLLDRVGTTEVQQYSASSGNVELGLGNNDYICSCCQKSFKTFWGIQRHIRRSHHSGGGLCDSQKAAKTPSLQLAVLLKQKRDCIVLERELAGKETDELTVSSSEVSGSHRMEFVNKMTAERSDKIMKNINKSDFSSLILPEKSYDYKVDNNRCDLYDQDSDTCEHLYHRHKQSPHCLRSCQSDQGKQHSYSRKRLCLSKNSNTDAKPIILGDQVHLCSWCHKICPNYAELQEHQQMQHNIKGFPCFLCGLTFVSLGRLVVHKIKKHRKYACSLCQAGVTGMTAFAKHVKLCSGRILAYEDENNKHQVTGDHQSAIDDDKVAENAHVCDSCGKVLSTEVKLRIHRNLHAFKSRLHTTTKVDSLEGLKSMDSIQISNGSDQLTVLMDRKGEELEARTKESCLHQGSHDVTKPHLKPNGLFSCGRCSLSYSSCFELKRHNHKCHRKKLFHCDDCNFSFAKIREQITHRRNCHRKHKCNQCNMIINGQLAFAKHVRSAHPGNPVYKVNEAIGYYCDLCNLYFVRRDSLLHHYETLHAVKKDKMRSKNRGGKDEQNASSESVFTCFWCGQGYESYVDLRKHRALEHRLKPFSCSDCHMTFVTQNAQITHRLKFHRKRRCNLCQVSVCGTVAFNEHVQSCHPGMSVAKVTSRQLVCEYCSAIFDHEKRLNDHIQTRHLGFVHTCKVCGKTLKTEETLRIHLRLHNTETYKTCEICGKQYPRLPGLMAHMRSQHPDNVPEKYRISFSCLHCGTNFTRSTTLRRHVETKHEGRRFACDICGKIFRNGRYISQHKKAHHPQSSAPNQ